MLSIFWRSSHIFIILLNKWNLCAEIALMSAMRFLYFFYHCFHWSLWYSAIAMLSLIKIIIERSNHLHLDCIFASSWINVFRSTTFLMTEKRKMRWLILISWACMSSHAHLISYVLSLTWLHNVTLFCSMFRWTCSKLVYISIFSILMLTLLNISATWRRVWFCRVSSLHSLSDSSFFLSRWCQTDASNAISDLTTAEYTCLTFVKIVSHVKTSRWLSVSILVTWLTSIYQRCTSHCSFMFSWIFETCTSDFNLIIELFIYMLVVMLNFLNFLVKCVSSYFSDVNVVSWVQVHFTQTLYVLLNVLQISSINLSWTRMLMSFMKLSTSILIFNALHFSIKLALKNRKKINEMKDSWDMFALILHIVLICSLNISDVSLFFRKLHAHSTM